MSLLGAPLTRSRPGSRWYDPSSTRPSIGVLIGTHAVTLQDFFIMMTERSVYRDTIRRVVQLRTYRRVIDQDADEDITPCSGSGVPVDATGGFVVDEAGAGVHFDRLA